ncbi:hypothetical protein ACHHYP_00866 [Achlya hypogyna]|uniref:Man1/Src1 C-terminal domain-containing protein n=1 Tax=Achlya hypogyna TaxID=1202772 RepID=A0A1V9ZA93_ACHHY|nr:hypothetical protein ACHHYP_00866 [Achlya hypogyna]
MQPDVVLSPRSELLSPVSKLHRVAELRAQAQKQRILAHMEKERRQIRSSKPLLRTPRKPTFEVAYRLYPRAARKEVETAVPLVKRKTPVEAKPEATIAKARVVVSIDDDVAVCHERATHASELARSYQLLKMAEKDERKWREMKGEKETKPSLLPTTNYHLKHMGMAAPGLDIYAPFAPQTKDISPSQPTQPASGTAQIKPAHEAPALEAPRRRSPTLAPASRSTPELPRRRKTKPSQDRLTPMKSRLRSHRRSSSPTLPTIESSESIPVVPVVVAAGSILSIALVVVYGSSMYQVTVAFAATARTWHVWHFLGELARYTVSHCIPILMAIGALLLVRLAVSYGSSAMEADDKMIEKLIVCTKEELLLHAKSNVAGHTAVREEFLREVVLDILGFKGDARDHPSGLWPSVRAALLTDSRVRRFRSKVKKPNGRPIHFWEWIAPQSTIAMTNYAERITDLRNEATPQ